MNKRILVAGLFHETHTFLCEPTPLEAFAIRRGDELFEARSDGSPLSGMLEVADDCNWDVIPTIDLRATPAGTCTDAVFDCFWSSFIKVAGPRLAEGTVDGIYLVLHGAMVCHSTDDVEGEIVRRIRSLPGGADIPICGVLDLHGNISADTIELTQGLSAYRYNPHTDACEAAIRGARVLEEILSSGKMPTSIWASIPVVWPPTGTGTDDDPMKSLGLMARDIEQRCPEIAFVNVMGGFAFADTPDTGVSFAATTFGDPDKARAELNQLCEWATEHRNLGNVVEPDLAEVIPDVKANIEKGNTPVILVEPADNIGGGAPGDTTGMLQSFLDNQFDAAAIVINDARVATELAACEPDKQVTVELGATSSGSFCDSVTVDARLISASDGRFTLEDRNSHLASMSGVNIDMGPCATLQVGGLSILVTSRKTPPFDLGQLRSQGIIPEQCNVIGVKAAVAHRRAFDPITGISFTVNTPGPCSSDLKSFPFERIRRPIFPLDADA